MRRCLSRSRGTSSRAGGDTWYGDAAGTAGERGTRASVWATTAVRREGEGEGVGTGRERNREGKGDRPRRERDREGKGKGWQRVASLDASSAGGWDNGVAGGG